MYLNIEQIDDIEMTYGLFNRGVIVEAVTCEKSERLKMTVASCPTL